MLCALPDRLASEVGLTMARMKESSRIEPKPGRVLVVDDNEQILHLVGLLLGRLGIDTIMASSGAAAMRWFEHNDRPDLLITDVSMPDMEGPVLYRALSGRFPGLPVLYMSGSPENDLPTGIYPLLRKPFDFHQLELMVIASMQIEPGMQKPLISG